MIAVVIAPTSQRHFYNKIDEHMGIAGGYTDHPGTLRAPNNTQEGKPNQPLWQHVTHALNDAGKSGAITHIVVLTDDADIATDADEAGYTVHHHSILEGAELTNWPHPNLVLDATEQALSASGANFNLKTDAIVRLPSNLIGLTPEHLQQLRIEHEGWKDAAPFLPAEAAYVRRMQGHKDKSDMPHYKLCAIVETAADMEKAVVKPNKKIPITQATLNLKGTMLIKHTEDLEILRTLGWSFGNASRAFSGNTEINEAHEDIRTDNYGQDGPDTSGWGNVPEGF